MKKIYKCIVVVVILLISSFIMSENSMYAKEKNAGVSIGTFKDKNVRRALKNKDKNKDGCLSNKELKKIKRLWISSFGGSIDLKGIEKLKYLEHLWIGSTHDSRKTKLKNLECLYKLKNMSVLCLRSCKNKKINLEYFKKLEGLYINWCKLQKLDLRKNKGLKVIDIDVCPIEKLNLSNCKKLKELTVSCKKLEKLNLKNNKNLKKLTYKFASNISSLKYNSQLTNLRIESAAMPEIKNNTKLKDVNLFNVEGEQLNFNERFSDLKTLSVSGGNIKKFNISRCDKLERIDLTSCDAEINVSECKKLLSLTVVDSNTIVGQIHNNTYLNYLTIYRSSINGRYYDADNYVLEK